MKRLSVMLVLSAGFSSTALAQAPAPIPGTGGTAEFVLIVYKSKELSLAAVGSRIPQSGPGEHPNAYSGLVQVPPGECTKVGTLPDPGILVPRANAARHDGDFQGKTLGAAGANVKGDFTSTVASFKQETKQCPPEQTLVTFQMFEVGRGTTYTFRQ